MAVVMAGCAATTQSWQERFAFCLTCEAEGRVEKKRARKQIIPYEIVTDLPVKAT
jgi:hypothetical protein